MTLLSELERTFGLALLALPRSVLRRIAGAPLHAPEGYALDLQTQVLVRVAERMGHGEFAPLGPVGARRAMERSAKALRPRPTGAVTVDELAIPVDGASIRARRYRPSGVSDTLPLIVFFHGGGFVVGSLDTHDGELRALALDVPATILSVAYRLAPEHRFPVPVEDGLAAFRFAARHAERWGADPARMAVMGDSAGGNLSAVVARETRGDAVRPVLQVLIYPATDLTRSLPSHRTFGTDYFLTTASLDWFLECYTRTAADMTHPMASPLLDGDHAGLPPAYVVTAGFDPLRDEGRAYADALARAGVPVEYSCREGLVHGFWQMTAGVVEARRAYEDVVAALRRGLVPRS